MNKELNNAFKKELNKNLKKIRGNNCSHRNGSRKLPSKNNINSYRRKIAGGEKNLLKTLDDLVNLEILKLRKALRRYYYTTYFREPVQGFIVNSRGTSFKTGLTLPRLRETNYV